MFVPWKHNKLEFKTRASPQMRKQAPENNSCYLTNTKADKLNPVDTQLGVKSIYDKLSSGNKLPSEHKHRVKQHGTN